MGWKEALEMELEVAVADALDGGPATQSAAAAAERNMRVVIDRFIAEGRIPNVKGYHLSVTGGSRLWVDLKFEEVKTASEVVVDTKRK